MKKNKLNISSEKGGAAVLVLFTVLTFIVILMGAFMSTSILRKSQIKSDLKIKEVYGNDVQRADEIYDEIVAKIEPSYDNPYMPEGFKHIGTEDWNSGYTIQEIATGNEFVWVPCVLNQADVKNGDIVQIFKKTTEGKYNENLLAISAVDTATTQAIKTSVATYGGFYIAKYEAGVPLAENGTEIAPTSAITSQKARSVAGPTVWTNISRADAITAAGNMINTSSTGVKSSLISGECWDTTLQWMVNSSKNAVSNAGYDTDSTGKGWYNQTVKVKTGQYSINNIFDMAGNTWEWTTEDFTNSTSGNMISRGGAYNCSASENPAAYRYGWGGAAGWGISFRVVLYK